MHSACESTPLLLGWREWLALPELGLPLIKAKVDTGARTSALHAFYVDPFTRAGAPYVRFGIHPLQHCPDLVVHAEAEVIDRRRVSDSGGHREERYVVSTLLQVAGREWPIELTLTNRESMLFRMLLGRTAMASGGARVDPACSFLAGRVAAAETCYRQTAPLGGSGPADDRI
ncbi:ATP-dependent zinc protease family protein [Marichromatium bheemlicum]|uniref:ATP-dependent zinc protease n=1 Tax=Marichromatium bheemlicum TaxID=365339 RepID=A0ABX1I3J5_9GAMM|nr:ATP-dependent zinc protease [Marichromatium bheemlicum]NKN31698.1 ATP-dependent zinc protease [Marichromatium bheemlicum]